MRVLIELPPVGMECTEDTDFDPLLARSAEHGAGGAAKQVIEQGPVVVEERPQQVRHGKGDMLPVAVGQDVLLFGDPLLGGFETPAAAGFGLAALAEKAGMGAVRRGAAITAHAHGAGAVGEHTFDDEFGPVAEGVAVFVEIAPPAIVMLEQQLCWVWEYTWCRVYKAAGDMKRASAPAGSRHRRAHFMRVSTRRGACHAPRGLVRSGGVGVEMRLDLKDS